MTSKEFLKELLSKIIDNTTDEDTFVANIVGIFGKDNFYNFTDEWRETLLDELSGSAGVALKEGLEAIGKEVDDDKIRTYISDYYLDGLYDATYYSDEGDIYAAFNDGYGYNFTTSEGHNSDDLADEFELTEEEVEELSTYLNDDTAYFSVASVERLCDWWIENKLNDINWEYVFEEFVD